MTLATVQDFRARLSEDVTLPSGLCVRIRAVTAGDFVGLGELPIPPAPVDDALPATPEQLAFLRRYTHRAIARGVLSPRMTDMVDDGGLPVCAPDVLHVQELYDALPEDYVALGQAINRRSGLTQEVRQQVDTFRPDGERAAAGESGGTLSPAPLRLADADPGAVLPQSETGRAGLRDASAAGTGTPAA